MSKIKDENYYQISGWMINRLNLKGTSLNVFAIIYGFSQDEETEFAGSRQYLVDFTNSSKPTIDKALNDLCELNYIIKIPKNINNITFNTYKVNFDIVESFKGGSKETLPPVKNFDLKETKENKETKEKEKSNINKEKEKKENKKEKKENYCRVDEKMPNFKDLIDNEVNNDNEEKEREKVPRKEKEKKSVSNDDLLEIVRYELSSLETYLYVVNEFIMMRNRIKKPLTEYAMKLICNKVKKLSDDMNTQIEIFEQSIVNGWQDVYAIKEYSKNAKQVVKVEEKPKEKKWYDI